MLLLIDLDNTLIDRRSAFKRWADSRFGVAHTPWLIDADQDGYESRAALAARIAARFRVDEITILAELQAGMVDQMVLDPRVAAALAEAVAAGFVPFVVTNGTVAQQEAKLRHTGLDRLVAGWTISEGAGVRKPDRRIFEAAAAAAGFPLDSTSGRADRSVAGWMVGDQPANDISGGAAAGLRTAWVSDGQPWPADASPSPTLIAPDCATALREITGLPGARPGR
ncbi:MAG TPA: HAD family hydrolase [Actinoplanes sp.]